MALSFALLVAAGVLGACGGGGSGGQPSVRQPVVGGECAANSFGSDSADSFGADSDSDSFNKSARELLSEIPFRRLAKDAMKGEADFGFAEKMFWRAATGGANELLYDFLPLKSGGVVLSSQSARAHFVGAISETEDAARMFHFRADADADGDNESSFGLLFRRDFGGALGGMNMFWDMENPGGFVRGGAGGEFRNEWAAVDGNIYAPISRGDKTRYSAGGYDFALNVRTPYNKNAVGSVSYSRFFGEYGDEDEFAFRAGLRLESAHYPARAALQYHRSDDGEYWRGEVGVAWEFGAPKSTPSSPLFRARDSFYDAPRREYSQRIRAVQNNAGENEDDFYVAEISPGTKPPDSMQDGNAGEWAEIFAAHSAWIMREFWTAGFLEKARTREFTNFGGDKRSVSFYVFSLAAALFTGAYDSAAAEAGEETAREVAAYIVRSLAACHIANNNCNGADSWGNDDWRIANFESHVVAAAWMSYSYLNEEDRANVGRMAHFSADRVAANPPEYATDVRSDTKAEENGWNAWALEIAANMYPRHKNANKWEDAAEQFRLAALAAPGDEKEGANLSGDYAAANHGAYPHPSYTAGAARQPLIGALYYRMGGNTPPAANTRNVPQIYKMMTEVRWVRRSNNRAIARADGRAIYDVRGIINWPHAIEPDRALHYWTYGLLDIFVGLGDFDDSEGALATRARGYESLHLSQLQKMQRADGAIIRRGRAHDLQHNQGRDVAAAYLTYWFAHNRGLNLTAEARAASAPTEGC